MRATTECNEVCAVLSSASVRCQKDEDCNNELVWTVPNPIPGVRESASLAVGVACCAWVEQTLSKVCENVNATMLAEFLSVHTTADMEGNCRVRPSPTRLLPPPPLGPVTALSCAIGVRAEALCARSGGSS